MIGGVVAAVAVVAIIVIVVIVIVFKRRGIFGSVLIKDFWLLKMIGQGWHKNDKGVRATQWCAGDTLHFTVIKIGQSLAA